MGVVKEGKLPCPFEGCTSSDAYHIFEDGSTYCFSCQQGTWVKPKPEELEKKFTSFRGVSKGVQEKLGFYSYVNKKGEVLFREYPYENGQSKWREVIPKKFWSTGRLPKLGGTQYWNAGSSKVICVVEGEEDAASFMEMVQLPVVWLTSASLGTDRKEIFEYLNPFQKIILAFESDDAGKKAKNILGTMFPGKVFEASLTKWKDANEYLVNGDAKEFFWAVTNAKLYTADFVKNTIEDFRQIIWDNEAVVYYPTPFDGLNALMKGLPLSKIVLIDGSEGLGKTEILRSFEYEMLKSHPDVPISITHHEETEREVLTGLASYHLKKSCRNPDDPVSNEELFEAICDLDKNGALHITEIGTEADSVKAVIDRFRYLATVCGVKVFFVDPINQFTPPDDGQSNITAFFDNLAQSMGRFVQEHNVCCVWTAHVNDEGNIRNSRMIGKACSIRISIERDHMHDDEMVKNTTKFYVKKNRPFSKTGIGGSVTFDPETFTLSEQTLPF